MVKRQEGNILATAIVVVIKRYSKNQQSEGVWVGMEVEREENTRRNNYYVWLSGVAFIGQLSCQNPL